MAHQERRRPERHHGRPPGRWRLAWQVLTDLPPEAKAEIVSGARQRYRRRLRFRRVWRRRLRGLDPGKPPFTVMRWFTVLGIALAWWANGSAISPLKMWLPYVVIAGVLILPDIAGFAIGSLRVDMRKTQEEVARLRQDVNAQARASAWAGIAIGTDAIVELTQAIARAAGEAIRGQVGGAATPWPPPGTGTPPAPIDSQPGQDVTS